MGLVNTIYGEHDICLSCGGENNTTVGFSGQLLIKKGNCIFDGIMQYNHYRDTEKKYLIGFFDGDAYIFWIMRGENSSPIRMDLPINPNIGKNKGVVSSIGTYHQDLGICEYYLVPEADEILIEAFDNSAKRAKNNLSTPERQFVSYITRMVEQIQQNMEFSDSLVNSEKNYLNCIESTAFNYSFRPGINGEEVYGDINIESVLRNNGVIDLSTDRKRVKMPE